MNASKCLRIALPAASLVLAAAACSEGSTAEPTDLDASVPPTTTGEAGVVDETDAGSLEDASGDAHEVDDATVDADAGPARTCSDEGWCHTAVPDGTTMTSVWGDGQGTVWAVSQEGNVLRWDGTAWVLTHAAGVPLYTIWGSSPTDLWAGGGALTKDAQVLPGVILHGTGSSPSAMTWTPVATAVTVRSIWGTSASDVYATTSVVHRVDSTDPSFVLHYAGPLGGDPAADWSTDAVSTSFPAHFEKVWGAGSDVFVSGRTASSPYFMNGQVIHRRSDGAGGSAWKAEAPSPGATTYTETFGFSVSPSLAFLVGVTGDYSGPSYHVGVSADDGATFTWTLHKGSETGFSQNAFSTLWASGANDVWIAGPAGRLRHWDGTDWRIAVVTLDQWPVLNGINAIWGTGPKDIWAVGADIALHKVAP